MAIRRKKKSNTSSPKSLVKSWSFSRYSDYKQCPLKFRLKHIDKIKEPPNDAMARGAEIHDKAEGYIKGKISRLPKELKAFSDEFKGLRKRYKNLENQPPFGITAPDITVEDTWAFTRNWDRTVWDDWIHCFLRIKLDVAVLDLDEEDTLDIIDWKTGKFRPENNDQYLEQIELYALAALILYPDIKTVRPQLAYIDQDVVFPDEDNIIEYIQKDVTKLKKKWATRIKPMINDHSFKPKPNNFCRWCFFRAENKDNGGGQCKY